MDLTNVAIHCPTKELAEKVLTKAGEMGYRWCYGESFLNETHWEAFKEKTCYNIEEGELYGLDWYESENYKIISAEEFLNGGKKVYKKCSCNAYTINNNGVDKYLKTSDCIDWLLEEAGYTKERETITIGENVYDKEEFENAVKNLKSLQ